MYAEVVSEGCWRAHQDGSHHLAPAQESSNPCQHWLCRLLCGHFGDVSVVSVLVGCIAEVGAKGSNVGGYSLHMHRGPQPTAWLAAGLAAAVVVGTDNPSSFRAGK